MKMTRETILLELLFPQFTKRDLKESRFSNLFSSSDILNMNIFEISLNRIYSNEDKRTTVLMENLPTQLTKEGLCSQLSDLGNINFLYFPYDKINKRNYGFAYINFINYKSVINVYNKFHGHIFPEYSMTLPFNVSYSKIQGKPKLSKTFSKKK